MRAELTRGRLEHNGGAEGMMEGLTRRGFLSAAAGAAAGAALAGEAPARAQANGQGNASNAGKPGKVRLSVTWGMVGRFPVAEAFDHLTELGYDAYEMFDWRNPDTLAAFAEQHKAHKLECSCLVGNKGVTAPGCSLTNPAERDAFLKEMEACAEACKAVDCKQILTLTGNDVPGMSREAMTESCVAGLKAVAPMLEQKGLQCCIEILNIHRDHPGYFLHYIADGVQMVEAVGSPSVKLLFDLYHNQIMEGNLIEKVRKNLKHVIHFHIGDVPGRHQPGTGEINYRNVYRAILDTGYTGTAALEYGPTVPVLEDLAAQRKLSIFEG